MTTVVNDVLTPIVSAECSGGRGPRMATTGEGGYTPWNRSAEGTKEFREPALARMWRVICNRFAGG